MYAAAVRGVPQPLPSPKSYTLACTQSPACNAAAQPDVAEGHANLASAYKDAARQDVAIASYRRALSLRPDFPEAFANLVHSLQVLPQQIRTAVISTAHVPVPETTWMLTHEACSRLGSILRTNNA